MKFERTDIEGVIIVRIEPLVDERGFFARTWCADEFAAAGLPNQLSQCSLSWNRQRHTLRGLHWQAEPHGEHKLIRCTHGAIFDVAVDLRPESPTYLRHVSVRLDDRNHSGLVVPPGCAHGFLTLEPFTEVEYRIDVPYVAISARGARWDDPAFGIAWPSRPDVVSDRDRCYPAFADPQLVPSIAATAKSA